MALFRGILPRPQRVGLCNSLGGGKLDVYSYRKTLSRGFEFRGCCIATLLYVMHVKA